MSKGGKSQTQTTAPPAYQLPYLQRGLASAENLYNQSGYNVAPFSQDQNQAFQMVRNRATQGDPTIGAASNYVQNTLNGGFMGSNPYADATFNRMAQATQGQLASQFAGSGRNVDQSQGLRAQQLNDLATQFYGGQYDAERNRMQGVLPYAQQLGNQGYTDAQALMGIGNQQQEFAQRVTDAPGTALDQYLSRVSGNMGNTTTAKSGGNKLNIGNLLGGALGLFGSLF